MERTGLVPDNAARGRVRRTRAILDSAARGRVERTDVANDSAARGRVDDTTKSSLDEQILLVLEVVVLH